MKNNQPITAFQRWYAKNRKALSEKRKERYRNDPVYRAKALENRRRQTMRTSRLIDSLPEIYTHNLAEAAEALGVSTWRLRDWRSKDYYPEPYRHGRELWFTRQQVYLLKEIRVFFDRHGSRLTKATKEDLQELVAFVTVNW